MKDSQYIIAADSYEREKHACRQVMATPELNEPIFGELGLGQLSWYVLDLETQWTGRKPGDIDVMGGILSWVHPTEFVDSLSMAQSELPGAHPRWHELLAARSLAEQGGIAWPPDLEYLIGVEFKCSYFQNGRVRSTKSSQQKTQDIRNQVDGLLKMGLDRVALVDILATHPTDGIGSDAWFGAIRESDSALHAASAFIAARLPADSPAGQFVLPIGAVVGGDESMRGAVWPRMIRSPQPNPFIADADARCSRRELTLRLKRMLSALPKPSSFPVVLIHCKSCNQVHHSEYACESGAS